MQSHGAGQYGERLREMLAVAFFRFKQEEIDHFAVGRDGRALQIIGIGCPQVVADAAGHFVRRRGVLRDFACEFICPF